MIREMRAEDIALVLRQEQSGVPFAILADSFSIDQETLSRWRARYSRLFQSKILGRPQSDDFDPGSVTETECPTLQPGTARVIYRECDPVLETALRECKIRHSVLPDLSATVRQLLSNSKNVGFLHGPVIFAVFEFGAPTLLNDEASVTIEQTVISGASAIESHVVIKAGDQDTGEPESAFLVFSAEARKHVSTGCADQPSRQNYPLREDVDCLYGIALDSRGVQRGNVLWCNGPLTIRMQSIAREPTDAIRTFYTSDLDAMVMGNYLLQK